MYIIRIKYKTLLRYGYGTLYINLCEGRRRTILKAVPAISGHFSEANASRQNMQYASRVVRAKPHCKTASF